MEKILTETVGRQSVGTYAIYSQHLEIYRSLHWWDEDSKRGGVHTAKSSLLKSAQPNVLLVQEKEDLCVGGRKYLQLFSRDIRRSSNHYSLLYPTYSGQGRLNMQVPSQDRQPKDSSVERKKKEVAEGIHLPRSWSWVPKGRRHSQGAFHQQCSIYRADHVGIESSGFWWGQPLSVMKATLLMSKSPRFCIWKFAIQPSSGLPKASFAWQEARGLSKTKFQSLKLPMLWFC